MLRSYIAFGEFLHLGYLECVRTAVSLPALQLPRPADKIQLETMITPDRSQEPGCNGLLSSIPAW